MPSIRIHIKVIHKRRSFCLLCGLRHSSSIPLDHRGRRLSCNYSLNTRIGKWTAINYGNSLMRVTGRCRRLVGVLVKCAALIGTGGRRRTFQRHLTLRMDLPGEWFIRSTPIITPFFDRRMIYRRFNLLPTNCCIYRQFITVHGKFLGLSWTIPSPTVCVDYYFWLIELWDCVEILTHEDSVVFAQSPIELIDNRPSSGPSGLDRQMTKERTAEADIWTWLTYNPIISNRNSNPRPKSGRRERRVEFNSLSGHRYQFPRRTEGGCGWRTCSFPVHQLLHLIPPTPPPPPSDGQRTRKCPTFGSIFD